MFSLLKKFKDGFAKTVSAIADQTAGIFHGKRIDPDSLDELEEALITADFGVETTAEILAEIKKAYTADKELQGRQAAEIGAAVLQRVLAGAEGSLVAAADKPTVIAMIGVNGSGKTTTAAKLGWWLKQDGQTVTLAACDTFRAAAVEQLKSWATKLDIEVIASQPGADAAAVAFDALAGSEGPRPRLPDRGHRGPVAHEGPSQGRTSEDPPRARRRPDPTAPQHRWLVVDGSLGDEFHRAGEGVPRELRADGAHCHEARRHQPRRCAGGHLAAAQDPDLFPRPG